MIKLKSTDAKTLKLWLDNNDCILIDVREDFEYKECYIENSLNIPLSQLLIKVDEMQDSQGKIIVLSCKAGVRSRLGGEALHNNGFDRELYNLENGIIGWIEQGFKVLAKNKI